MLRKPKIPQQPALAHFHPSRFAFFKLYFVAAVLLVATAALWLAKLPSIILPYKTYILLLIPLAAIMIIVAEIKRQCSAYTITNNDVSERSGILSIKESTVTVDRISSSTINQSILDRILKIGSIDLWSTGGSEKPEITVDKIPDVQKIKEMIDRLIQRH